MARGAILLLAALILIYSSAVLAEQKVEKVIKGLDDVHILKSREDSHKVLLEACKACHPDADYKFWMLVFGKGEPRIEAITESGSPQKASSDEDATAGERRPTRIGTWDYANSHDYFQCEFCHSSKPNLDDKNPMFTMPPSDLCALCHTGKNVLHLYEAGGQGQTVELAKLLKHGLPTDDGKVVCLTCHQTHNALYSTRPGYIKAEIEERSVNPHGGKLYCLLCHEGKLDDASKVSFRKQNDFIALCTACHNMQETESEHHQVGVQPGEDTWKVGFSGFPLQAGSLSCVTCHDEPCQLPRGRSNPNFLRGGPYSSDSEFCFRCHAEDKTEALNPHKQISGLGMIKKETCTICHSAVPDKGTGLTPRTALREETNPLCQKCHMDEVLHPVVNHLVSLPSEMTAMKLAYEEKHKVVLPLEGNSVITCTTCHNPHDKGVLKGDMGVGAGEIQGLRLPDFREICAPCHGRQ